MDFGVSRDCELVETQLCPTLCDSMNRSTPGLPVHHQLPEFTQTLHLMGSSPSRIQGYPQDERRWQERK